jgi:hypothetical protein
MARRVRHELATASQYAGTAARVLRRRGRGVRARPVPPAPVFVVGSPRSGTTFLGDALGAQPGLVDLGEVRPLRAGLPELVLLPEADAAARIRRILQLVRRLSLSTHLRVVEQMPETAFVLGAALRAFPDARAVHLVRDGRDVACSLLEAGWLGTTIVGTDDIGKPWGPHARFWVEDERRSDFERASEATRAAWTWRRYVTAARAVPGRTLELRYEELAADPPAAASRLASFLDLDAGPLTESLAGAHGRSVGRWRRELTPEQLADVEREAGPLLRELGYAGP